MRQSEIDTLTRRIAQRTGRRALATGILGGLLTALLPGLSAVDAAPPKKRGRGKQPRCKKPTRRCGKQCVNLTNNRRHCGKCNRACKPGHSCRQGTCVAPPPPPSCADGGRCLVFITSTTYTGNLGGLSGADQKCNERAQAAGLPGTYKAWLSTASANAASRLRHHQGRYFRVDGEHVSLGWNELTSGHLYGAISKTEFGDDPPQPWAWTGTHVEGTWTGRDCTGWQSGSSAVEGTFGIRHATISWWSYHTVQAGGEEYQCNRTYGLYCFQQT